MNEAFVGQTIHKFLLSDGTAFDIGANIGSYTQQIASKFRQVFAFEPHPENLVALKQSISYAPNVTVVEKAIGAQSGTLNLYTCATNGGGHSIAEAVAKAEQWGHSVHTFMEVPTVSIDDFVAEHNISDLKFIKMDIEGAESFVWQGAVNTLRTQNVDILLEVHNTVDLKGLFDFFLALHYNWFDPQLNGVMQLRHDEHYYLTKRAYP